MSGGYREVHVQCPFYVTYNKRNVQVTCEGTVPDTLEGPKFRDGKAWDRHFRAHCCDDWRSCGHARALITLYYPWDRD